MVPYILNDLHHNNAFLSIEGHFVNSIAKLIQIISLISFMHRQKKVWGIYRRRIVIIIYKLSCCNNLKYIQ